MAGQTVNQKQIQGTTLGYVQTTSGTNTTTSLAAVGLSSTVTIPAGGRRVKVTVYSYGVQYGNSNTTVTLWDGALSTGTQLQEAYFSAGAGSISQPLTIVYVGTLTGTHTFNVGIVSSSAGAVFSAAANAPAFMLVELI